MFLLVLLLWHISCDNLSVKDWFWVVKLYNKTSDGNSGKKFSNWVTRQEQVSMLSEQQRGGRHECARQRPSLIQAPHGPWSHKQAQRCLHLCRKMCFLNKPIFFHENNNSGVEYYNCLGEKKASETWRLWRMRIMINKKILASKIKLCVRLLPTAGIHL